MNLYVYSTLSADVIYQNHVPGGADLPIVVFELLIKGGAGVANDRLVTPRGVATQITEAQAEALEQNEVFKLHKKNGFVEISERKVNPDKVAADMTGRDASAPIVPQDLPANSQPMSVDEDETEAAPSTKHKRR